MTLSGYWTPPDMFEEIGADAGSELMAELVDSFRLDSGEHLRILREAIAAFDLVRVRREAHSVKGSAKQMGADTMASLCDEIEIAAETGQWRELAVVARRLDESFSHVCLAMTVYRSAPTASVI
jgi:HPt (histidine-containing phosphotransfer) domain-containing protein